MASAADWPSDGDEWELINDDGFVYKRRKRPRIDAIPIAPPPDPASEERNRLERKQRALIKIKEKYQKEIERWEHLSNTLKLMEERSSIQAEQPQDHPTTSSHEGPCSTASPSQPSESNSRQVLEELLSKAEAHEELIKNLSNLCDVAEAMCSAQEEKSDQSFFELPVWDSSPRELISALCEENKKEVASFCANLYIEL